MNLQISFRYIFSLLVALSGITISGCSPSKVDVVGEYRADYAVAKEHLVLRSDGHFVQEIILKGKGEKAKSEGVWSYGSDSVVTFENGFIVVTDGYGEVSLDFPKPATGLVGLPAESWFGRIYLGVNKGILYSRIGP